MCGQFEVEIGKCTLAKQSAASSQGASSQAQPKARAPKVLEIEKPKIREMSEMSRPHAHARFDVLS